MRTATQTRSGWRSTSPMRRSPTGSPRCSQVCRACGWSAGRDGRCGRGAVPDPSPAADGDVPLTPRELEVLALLAEGASNKMIAQRLGISVHTAKFHVGSLLDKLDAVGRTDAVAHAARLGVINL